MFLNTIVIYNLKHTCGNSVYALVNRGFESK